MIVEFETSPYAVRRSTTTGKTYQLVLTDITFDEAKTQAQSLVYKGQNGHLAAITTAEESHFILSEFGLAGSQFWTAGKGTANNYVWQDGPLGVKDTAMPEAKSNIYFSGDLPSTGTQTQCYFYHREGLKRTRCTEKMSYLVEFPQCSLTCSSGCTTNCTKEGVANTFSLIPAASKSAWLLASQQAGTIVSHGTRGHLATLETQAEADLISAMLVGNELDSSVWVWVGHNDLQTPKAWRIGAGPKFADQFYSGTAATGQATNGYPDVWADGEPNNANNNRCGAIRAPGSGLSDVSCSSTLPSFTVVEFESSPNWGARQTNPATNITYELIQTQATFDDALRLAAQNTYQGISGHLATVTTVAETNYLKSAFRSGGQNYWIGGKGRKNNYRWQDGPLKDQKLPSGTGFNSMYSGTDHRTNKPSNGGQRCYRLTTLGLSQAACTVKNGVLIEYPADLCLSSPCPSGSTCVWPAGSSNTFTCTCAQGRTYNSGTNTCDDIDGCQNHDCGTKENCVDAKAPNIGFSCECKDGFQENNGNCQNINMCENFPCVNGTCKDIFGGPTDITGRTCDCDPGFEFLDQLQSCIELDSCASNPCTGGQADCKDLPAPSTSFLCFCKPGYYPDPLAPDTDRATGSDCIDIPACVFFPCDENAHCEEIIGGTNDTQGRTCFCGTGWEGSGEPGQCTDINDCQPNKCKDEISECVDRKAPLVGYDCKCTENYVGPLSQDGRSCQALCNCASDEHCKTLSAERGHLCVHNDCPSNGRAFIGTPSNLSSFSELLICASAPLYEIVLEGELDVLLHNATNKSPLLRTCFNTTTPQVFHHNASSLVVCATSIRVFGSVIRSPPQASASMNNPTIFTHLDRLVMMADKLIFAGASVIGLD
eukprot:m.255848 g.255848  ORF g.255848 m.255848 type:complete len:881 (+) comp26740_c1_seq6:186-2828(+)